MFALEQVERDGASVVGVEQFAPLALQNLQAAGGGGSGLFCFGEVAVQVLAQQAVQQVAVVAGQVHVLPELFDALLDEFDRHCLADAVRAALFDKTIRCPRLSGEDLLAAVQKARTEFDRLIAQNLAFARAGLQDR